MPLCLAFCLQGAERACQVVSVKLYLVRQHGILRSLGNCGHHAHTLEGELPVGGFS